MKPKGQSEVKGLSSTDWEHLFLNASIEVEKLDAAKSKRAKATIIGNWFNRNADREVAIRVGDRTGKAKLKIREGRSKKKFYVFEIRWDKIEDIEGEPRSDLRKPGKISGSSVPKVEATATKKKQVVKRKGKISVKKKQNVINKSPKQTPTTHKKKKVIAKIKKKALQAMAGARAKKLASSKRPSGQNQLQGNSELW